MFISYAQNYENVLLYRALGDIEHGCYIDVGAADPVFDSVTCAFYQRGWRGINLEPSPAPFMRLVEVRREDVNLNLASGDVEGTTSFFVVQGADILSTALPGQREALAGQGYKAKQIEVPVRTLAAVLEENAVGTIHFLKIDVEGLERAVLVGADLRRFRPWIILIEATAPTSRLPTHHQWEDLLIAADYRFAWFDGLNRYYVSAEKSELASALQMPPNVFDKFKRYDEALAQHQLAEVRVELTEAGSRQQQTEAAARPAGGAGCRVGGAPQAGGGLDAGRRSRARDACVPTAPPPNRHGARPRNRSVPRPARAPGRRPGRRC
jgi:FkbM family methyltransferase